MALIAPMLLRMSGSPWRDAVAFAGVSVMESQRMLERFVRLCEISSPTGDERAVADAVLEELRALDIEVSEDDSA
ncbi:MAG: hypothetical protein M3M99_06440, partial [Actinomycetota bacterium]|nr:hypothetical protein [Actinomycetota bacterium]